MLKKLILPVVIAVCLLQTGRAAPLTICNFGTGDSISGAIFSDTWVGSLTETLTTSTIGSPATDFGNFINVVSVPSLNSYNGFAIAARLDSGNTATNFQVRAFTSLSDYVTAQFNASSFNSSGFTTATATWTVVGSFNPANVIGWGINGGAPSSTTTFRMSFDKLEAVAVPEPSTWILLAFSLTPLVIFRRRSRVA